MSGKDALNIDKSQTSSENNKSIRVWLWRINKITEDNCRSRLFTKFIRTQKKYPASLTN